MPPSVRINAENVYLLSDPVPIGPTGPSGTPGPMGPPGPPGASGLETPTGLNVAFDGLLTIDGQPTDLPKFGIATPDPVAMKLDLRSWNDYTAGHGMTLFMTVTNEANCTLDVSDLGPVPVVDDSGLPVTAGMLLAGNWYYFVYMANDTFRFRSTSSPYIVFNDSSDTNVDSYKVDCDPPITALHAEFKFVFIPNSDSTDTPSMTVDEIPPVPVVGDLPLRAGTPYVLTFEGEHFISRRAFRALQGEPFSIVSGDSSLDISGPSLVFGTQNLVAAGSNDLLVFGFHNMVGRDRPTSLSLIMGGQNSLNADQSAILGCGNTVSGTHTLIVGEDNTCSETSALVFGDRNVITGDRNLVVGTGVDDHGNAHGFIQGGGIGQIERFAFTGTTTGQPVQLTSDGDQPYFGNLAALADRSAALVSVTFVAFCSATMTAATWKLEDALLLRTVGAATLRFIGEPTFHEGVATAQMPAPTIEAADGVKIMWTPPENCTDTWNLLAKVALLRVR